MIGYLRTSVCKQPTIALYFEFDIVLKFYNLQAWHKFEFHFMQLHINKSFLMNNGRVTVLAK